MHIYNKHPHIKSKALDVIISAPNGDYACFAGMWLVAANNLTYLEPLCTMEKRIKCDNLRIESLRTQNPSLGQLVS